MTDILPRLETAFREAHPDFIYRPWHSPPFGGLDYAFLTLAGSHSHNTYVPKDDPDSIDDIDIMGVVPLPPFHLFGLKSFEHWVYKKDDLDVTVYSLPKFVSLLLKGNPNVMGLLWIRPEDRLQDQEWMERLRLNAWMFASKKNVYESFVGYAKGQMEKMVSYTPAIDEEIQKLGKFLLAEGIDHETAIHYTPDHSDSFSVGDAVVRYKQLNKKFHFAYMGDKRKQLVRKHGYDSKNAAHMIRLLSMAIEYLETGKMQVYRTTDVHKIKEIKRGVWELEQVKEHANDLFRQAQYAFDRSILPEYPDVENANDLLIEIAQENY